MSSRLCQAMVFVVSAVVVLSVGSSRAAAQEAEYTEMLNEAAEVYNTGNLTKALLAYLEIRAKYSGPEVDYSLGRTYQRLYQCEDAGRFYSYVMSNYGLAEDHPLFSKAAGYYTALLNCDAWGEVAVNCSTPAAILYIDGEMTGTCMERTYRLPEGTYTFRLEAEGTEPVESTATVTDGSLGTVTLELQEKVVEKIVEVPVEVPVASGGGGETNWIAWSLVGVGAASLTAAAFFNAAGYDALVDVQRAADAGDSSARSAAEDDVSTNSILTGVFFGLGLAAAAGGATWLIIDAVSDDGTESDALGDASPWLHRLEVGASPSADGGAVMVQGRF